MERSGLKRMQERLPHLAGLFLLYVNKWGKGKRRSYIGSADYISVWVKGKNGRK